MVSEISVRGNITGTNKIKIASFILPCCNKIQVKYKVRNANKTQKQSFAHSL
ncbi:MAG: hypothetical protein K6E40_15115 [Desulfovibrio sp.]|nr:hypothetical protein [Desulfovibrio sp.]